MTSVDPALARFLKAAGIADPVTIQPLQGGANNRVFRVDAAGRTVLAKKYFRHPADTRDRLGAESSFLGFSADRSLTCVPKLLMVGRREGFALMEFIPGRKLRPGEVTWTHVAQAVAFFVGLNRHRTSPAAGRLSAGSEACFSREAHLNCVDRRLARLATVSGASAVGKDAVRFIRERLVPAWDSLSARIRSVRGGSAELPRADRCISPSDFGFHNALRRADGRLCFLDFEYAGWDDPAKTACDFFCQPAVPVPVRYLDRFVEGISEGFRRREALRDRVRLLLPAYRMKWCCILLNEFLPVGGARRRFAAQDCDPERRKADQLKKAKTALEGIDA